MGAQSSKMILISQCHYKIAQIPSITKKTLRKGHCTYLSGIAQVFLSVFHRQVQVFYLHLAVFAVFRQHSLQDYYITSIKISQFTVNKVVLSTYTLVL